MWCAVVEGEPRAVEPLGDMSLLKMRFGKSEVVQQVPLLQSWMVVWPVPAMQFL